MHGGVCHLYARKAPVCTVARTKRVYALGISAGVSWAWGSTRLHIAMILMDGRYPREKSHVERCALLSLAIRDVDHDARVKMSDRNSPG